MTRILDAARYRTRVIPAPLSGTAAQQYLWHLGSYGVPVWLRGKRLRRWHPGLRAALTLKQRPEWWATGHPFVARRMR